MPHAVAIRASFHLWVPLPGVSFAMVCGAEASPPQSCRRLDDLGSAIIDSCCGSQ